MLSYKETFAYKQTFVYKKQREENRLGMWLFAGVLIGESVLAFAFLMLRG